MGHTPSEGRAPSGPANTSEAPALVVSSGAGVTLSAGTVARMVEQLYAALGSAESSDDDGKPCGEQNRGFDENKRQLVTLVHNELRDALRKSVPSTATPGDTMETRRLSDAVSSDLEVPEMPGAVTGVLPAAEEKLVAAEPIEFQDKKADPAQWCPPELVESVREICGIDFTNPEVYTYVDSPVPEEQAAISGWRLLGGTRRGRGHANESEHREDAYRFVSDGETYAVATVSDGVGSSELSRLGSEITCRLVCRELAKWCGTVLPALIQSRDQEYLRSQARSAIRDAISEASNRLVKLAAAVQYRPDDFACTLVIGILHGGPDGEVAHLTQVGDGAIGFLTMDDGTRQYPPPVTGQFSGQIEFCIPDARSAEVAKRSLDLRNIRAMFLCTDGVEDVFYPIYKHGATIFEQLCHGVTEPAAGCKQQPPHGPVLGQLEATARLEQWLAFEKRGEYDDRTILILHRDPLGDVARTIAAAPAPAASAVKPAEPASPNPVPVPAATPVNPVEHVLSNPALGQAAASAAKPAVTAPEVVPSSHDAAPPGPAPTNKESSVGTDHPAAGTATGDKALAPASVAQNVPPVSAETMTAVDAVVSPPEHASPPPTAVPPDAGAGSVAAAEGVIVDADDGPSMTPVHSDS